MGMSLSFEGRGGGGGVSCALLRGKEGFGGLLRERNRWGVIDV